MCVETELCRSDFRKDLWKQSLKIFARKNTAIGNKQECGTLALQRYLLINRKEPLTTIFSHDDLRLLHISRVHLIHPEHVYIREAGRNMGKEKKNTRVTKRREKGKLILMCHGYQHTGNTDSVGKQILLFFCF